MIAFDPLFPTAPVSIPEPWLYVLLSPFSRVFAFVWGLLWGSFTNVVIYRTVVNLRALLRGEKTTFADGAKRTFWRGRSRCPHCEHAIAAYDNIPVVSFLILRGKCRHCETPLSMRYLIVELVGGMLSFALFMQQVYVPVLEGHGPNIAAWMLWLLFGLAMLTVVYVDLDVFLIPDFVVVALIAVGLITVGVDDSVLGTPWRQALAAGAGAGGLFVLIHLYYTKVRGIDGLGLGDAKLVAVFGLWLGPLGVAFAICAGAMQGLLIALPMRLRGRAVANANLQELHGDDDEMIADDPDDVLKQRVPFGPFLVLGAMEFVLMRRSIEDVLAWWVSGGAF